jgi:thiol-disulfide isomerase/thioredoxin
MNPATTRRLAGCTWSALALCLTACAFPPAVDSSRSWTTIDGARFEPTVIAPGAVRVLVFTTTECPIANSYAPRLVELADMWRNRDVEIVLVHVDPDATNESLRQHAADYALPFVIVHDREQRLCAQLGVEVTPECAVMVRHGLAYLGRIDDRWRGRGKDSQSASTHDLRDAVDALLRGETPNVARTEPVGCRLPTAP